MKKDFISILDIDELELEQLLNEAHQLKRQTKSGTKHLLLAGQTLR